MKHIICFHLYNDYSGSPKVLNTVLEGIANKDYRIDLVTSKGGVLDTLKVYDNIHIHSYPYGFTHNFFIQSLRYILSQLYTFFLSFRWLFDKDAVFYINTIMPFGPALAGRIMGKQVIYHYHENAFAKGAFYKTLCWIMQRLAHKIICVSEYQASYLKRKKNVIVIPNALPKDFVSKLKSNPEEAFERKTVLMLSSLKDYKGTKEFIQLSNKLPQYKFVLVVNDTQENICKYLNDNNLTEKRGEGNLIIYSRQSEVIEFYNGVSLVLNLTNKFMAVETFGMTALEAMSAGLPVIVPTVGGVAEMVEDGVNGYKIDVQELASIKAMIENLFEDKELYIKMAKEAKERSLKYNKAEYDVF